MNAVRESGVETIADHTTFDDPAPPMLIIGRAQGLRAVITDVKRFISAGSVLLLDDVTK